MKMRGMNPNSNQFIKLLFWTAVIVIPVLAVLVNMLCPSMATLAGLFIVQMSMFLICFLYNLFTGYYSHHSQDTVTESDGVQDSDYETLPAVQDSDANSTPVYQESQNN